MDRFKSAKIASILGIALNAFLLIIKGITGILTNSQAMIADAFNSASDIFSSVMTFVRNRVASKPRDADHNLGHGKAEYVFSMLISITMFLLSIKLLSSSFKSLLYGSEYNFSIWIIIVCIVTIITKFALYIYTHKISKKFNNLLIDANSKDHRNDCAITFLNLIAAILSLYEIYLVDSIVGICISLWIFMTSIKIFKESYDVLMDKSISKETKIKVYDLIKKHEEIKKVNHFNSTPVGYRYQISLTIFVDGNMTTFESHKIADDLEKEIIKTFPEIYLAVIHVNPMDVTKLEEKKKK